MRAIRWMLIVSAAYMVLGIPFGTLLLNAGVTGEVRKVAWALILAGLGGILILVDLLVVEPWNFRRAREEARYLGMSCTD